MFWERGRERQRETAMQALYPSYEPNNIKQVCMKRPLFTEMANLKKSKFLHLDEAFQHT